MFLIVILLAVCKGSEDLSKANLGPLIQFLYKLHSRKEVTETEECTLPDILANSELKSLTQLQNKDSKAQKLNKLIESGKNQVDKSYSKLLHNIEHTKFLTDQRCQDNFYFLEQLTETKANLQRVQTLRETFEEYFSPKVVALQLESFTDKLAGFDNSIDSDLNALLTKLEHKLLAQFKLMENLQMKGAKNLVEWDTVMEKESAQHLEQIERQELSNANVERDLKTANNRSKLFHQVWEASKSAREKAQSLCKLQEEYLDQKAQLDTQVQEALEELLFIFSSQFPEYKEFTLGNL